MCSIYVLFLPRTAVRSVCTNTNPSVLRSSINRAASCLPRLWSGASPEQMALRDCARRRSRSVRIQPFSFLYLSSFTLNASSKKKRVSEVEVSPPPLLPPHLSLNVYIQALCQNSAATLYRRSHSGKLVRAALLSIWRHAVLLICFHRVRSVDLFEVSGNDTNRWTRFMMKL